MPDHPHPLPFLRLKMVDKTIETFRSLDATYNHAGVQSLLTKTATAVLWICSPAARFMIGHFLAIERGYTIQ